MALTQWTAVAVLRWPPRGKAGRLLRRVLPQFGLVLALSASAEAPDGAALGHLRRLFDQEVSVQLG